MHNFRKNTKLYIVESGSKYQIDIYSDIKVSQTFNEQSYKRKTLHQQLHLHEHAVINNANPANFSFTTPLTNSVETELVLRLASSYESSGFDIYLEADNVLYKLTKAVIESLVFNLERGSVITLSIEGTASQLAKVSSIPGTQITKQPREYNSIDKLYIELNGDILDSVAAINIEVQKDIAWSKHTTVHAALESGISYPQNYVTQGRTFSGSITQFLTENNVDLGVDTSTTGALIIRAYMGAQLILEFNLTSVVFTRRLTVGELFTRVYDFRVNTNFGDILPEFHRTT